MGYPVFYSDNEAKVILDSDPAARAEITRLFGAEAYTENQLDRNLVAARVFKQPGLLESLNNIVHPRVRARFETWVQEQKSPVVFNEAAILFETGSYKKNTFNILVTSPLPLRIQRVMHRDNVSEEKVLERMKNQWPDEQKIPLADFVITNNETEMLIPQVLSALKKIAP
jgi:dephospho-CoA kinase